MHEVKMSTVQACIKYTCMFANLTYMYTVHLFMWVHFLQVNFKALYLNTCICAIFAMPEFVNLFLVIYLHKTYM